jgi:hypothetical protein
MAMANVDAISLFLLDLRPISVPDEEVGTDYITGPVWISITTILVLWVF